MKKFFLTVFFIFFLITPLQALEEDFEKPIILEPHERAQEEKISPFTKKALKGIIEKDYDLKSTDGMFNEQLYVQFERGFVNDIRFYSHFVHSFDENISDNDSNLKFNTNIINVGFGGKFKSEKETYNFLFDLTPNAFDDYSHRFLLDAFLQTTRVKNHKILLGNSRPQVGIEGGQSARTIPFLLRSQSARNLSNARKTGLKIKGDYKYVNYEVGGYSSDVRFHEFFPGVETTLWLGFKPLANFDNKYGTLYLGGGVNTGERNNVDFTVVSTALTYDYKKFSFQAEYQHADGSNGASGLTSAKAQGYNLTLGYMLTKKLQFLLRYDDFDSNKSIKNNNSREYSAGLNWFILGQTARMILNYVYCDNEIRDNSHRIILGTQFIL